MDPGLLERYFKLLEEEKQARRYQKLLYMFPDEGEFARHRYPKHMELLRASGHKHELNLLGGNGAGKSLFGSWFTSVLATGRYPPWWSGYRVNGPIRCWVSGVTKLEVRTSTQKYLLGDVAEKGDEYLGTGMIPREDIVDVHWLQNRACDFVTVRNYAGPGGLSTIRFKSYEQGRESYQAENLHFAWQDEEPPDEIHGETMMRFRGLDGRMLTTATPLQGLTHFMNRALNWRTDNDKEGSSRYTVVVGMREVPHLHEDEINRMLAASPAYQRKARETGMPTVGEGLVYPVEEDAFVIPPFKIPPHFRRVFGFDGGWHNTAIVWAAHDVDEDTVYLYKDYKRGQQLIPVHASAIKQQGVWIPGIGDVYASSQADGEKVQKLYRDEGVRIAKADKAVDAGIQAVLERLETGRLKVFSTCHLWLEEFRKYRYHKQETKTGDKSVIVKKDDHLMDATRYVIYDGLKRAKPYRGDIERPVSSGEKTFGLH